MAMTYHRVSAKLSRIDSIKWCKYAVELCPYIQALIIGGCVRNRKQQEWNLRAESPALETRVSVHLMQETSHPMVYI